jgi:hypothetical protein
LEEPDHNYKFVNQHAHAASPRNSFMTFWVTITAAALAFAPPARPVALVHEVSGEVELMPAHGKPTKCQPKKQLIYLYVGDQMRLEPKARVAVGFLGDFHWEHLKPGLIRVGENGCEPRELVEQVDPPAQCHSKAAKHGLDAIKGGSGGRGAGRILRGSGPVQTPPQVKPVFGEAVTSDQPVLTWSAIPEAKGYQVNLLHVGSGRSVWSAHAEKPRLEYPADHPALKRNRTYDWQVSAEMPDGSVAQIVFSRFTVIGASVVEDLQSLKPLAESGQPADLLLAIASYQAYNAEGPALATCEKLAKLTPEDPGVYRLLADLYRRAGRTADSTAAADQAAKLEERPEGDSKTDSPSSK